MKVESAQPVRKPALYSPIVTMAALALAAVTLLTSHHGTTGTTVCVSAAAENDAAMTGKTLSGLHARIVTPEIERDPASTF